MRSSMLACVVVAGVAIAAPTEAQVLSQFALREGALVSPAGPIAGWTFGPAKPHAVDAMKRTGYGLAGGAAFMLLGLGVDKLNHLQCTSRTPCIGGNALQTGASFAFLGAVAVGSGPVLHSHCTRTGRAVLAIIGAWLGGVTASRMLGESIFSGAATGKATWKTMGSALGGLSVGTGVVTAIC
ncbi:MAG TPA: hypothetical protein VF483_13375 [Gemmatimonadaceae bacterium]